MQLARHTFRPDWRWLPTLFLAAFLLIGCGADDDDDDTGALGAEEEEMGYRLGDPVTDPDIALLIASDGGDTLAVLPTALFQERYMAFIQQVPAVALDEQQSTELRRGIAEEFVRRTILGQEGERLNLTVDDALVNEQIELIRSQVGGQEQLEQILAMRSISMDSLRRSIGDDLVLQQTQERMAEGAAEPTAEELEAFRKEQAQQVRAQHILFRMPDSAAEDSVLRLANAVLDSAKAGTDFGALAGRYGSDGTRARGGDLGYFSRRDMVKPFSDAAFALADSGDVAEELVETSFGYHIIRLAGRREAALMDSTQAQAAMMQDRRVEAFDAAYDALRQQFVVRVNPDVVKADINEKSDD